MDMITRGNGVVVFIFERGFFPFRCFTFSSVVVGVVVAAFHRKRERDIALFAVSVTNIIHFTDMQFAFPFRSVCAMAIAVVVMATGNWLLVAGHLQRLCNCPSRNDCCMWKMYWNCDNFAGVSSSFLFLFIFIFHIFFLFVGDFSYFRCIG